MSGDDYRCPVPGEDGVRAGDGGRLGAMLRAGACGMHADEAAVELLLGTDTGPGTASSPAVSRRCRAATDPGGVPVAGIDWQAAASGLGGAGLACSASKAGCAAASPRAWAAGCRSACGRCWAGLTMSDIALVARAVPHANGTTSATVTVPEPPRFPPGTEVAGAGRGVRRGR